MWKSVTVTNFKVAPSDKLDKRSCKSDQITVTVDPATPTKYQIQAKYDDEVQISLEYDALCPGFKLGAGPKGGMTYFGQLSAKPTPAGDAPDYAAGGDGYCVHRFLPRCAVSGIVRVGADVIDLAGSRGVFIHAIQGLRPNLLAAKWNFCNFQTVDKEGDEAVSLILMEFTTPPGYGSKVVTVGSVVVGDKLVAVSSGGSGIVGGAQAQHEDAVVDAETGYAAPGAIKFSWEAPRLEEAAGGAAADKLVAATEGNSKVHATIQLDLVTDKAKYETRGLVEKVDVLGQIPYLIRKFVNYAAGTKPYIYTVRCLVPLQLCPDAPTLTHALTRSLTVAQPDQGEHHARLGQRDQDARRRGLLVRRGVLHLRVDAVVPLARSHLPLYSRRPDPPRLCTRYSRAPISSQLHPFASQVS